MGAKRLLSMYGEPYQEATKLVLLSEKIPKDFYVWVSSYLRPDFTFCDWHGVQVSD